MRIDQGGDGGDCASDELPHAHDRVRSLVVQNSNDECTVHCNCNST